MIRCSIIIRSFNEEKHIGRLLQGIQHQSIDQEIEVILVDSGSTDATVSIAQSMGAKVLHISPEEFSFGRALNKGCEIAGGEILLFASAHVYPVYRNWISKMLEPFSEPKVALVYGRQIGNELTKYSEKQLFLKWFPAHSNFDQESPFCNNANCAIRKSLWSDNHYDEYLTGLEDLDWSNRIKKSGYRIAYQADAPIVHVHEETFEKIKNRYRREAIALKKIMPKQHLNFFEFLYLTSGHIFSDALHAIQERVFLKNIGSIIQFRTMQFYGSFMGFRQRGDINQQLKNRFYYPKRFIRSKIEKVEPGERINYEVEDAAY